VEVPQSLKEVKKLLASRTTLERSATEGDSPVGESEQSSAGNLEYHGAR
jgi:hypothetical protein